MNPEARAKAIAWVEARAEAVRSDLVDLAVATETFSGHRPGGGSPFRCAQGTRLPRSHPLVVNYPEKFRMLTSVEIARDIKGVVTRARASVGL
jgi:hypothetical protein